MPPSPCATDRAGIGPGYVRAARGEDPTARMIRSPAGDRGQESLVTLQGTHLRVSGLVTHVIHHQSNSIEQRLDSSHS